MFKTICCIFTCLLLLSACSSYSSINNAKVLTIEHQKLNKDLSTGSKIIESPRKRFKRHNPYLFADITKLSKFEFIEARLSKYEWSFYEDSNDIYFWIKDHNFDYYDKRNPKGYYTKEELFGLTKEFYNEKKSGKNVYLKANDSIKKKWVNKAYRNVYPKWWETRPQLEDLNKLEKISKNNISCNEYKKICKIYGYKSNNIVTVRFNNSMVFEYVKFNKVKHNYLNALNTYNINLVKNYKNTGIKSFLSINKFEKAIEKAKTTSDIDTVVKIAKLENITLSNIGIDNKRNQINFTNNYNYYITEASEKELEQILNNNELLYSVDNNKILELKSLKKHHEINRILKSNSLPLLFDYYNQTKNYEVKSKILNIAKRRNDFESNIILFKTTENIDYLKKAGKKAGNIKEELIIEKLLFETIALDKLFKVQDISTSRKSETHNLVGENLSFLQDISEISTSTKKLTKKFKLSTNSKMVGNYKVKVDFILETKVEAETVNNSNWLGKLYNVIGKIAPHVSKKTYSTVFYINQNNNYQDIKKVEFNIMGVSFNSLGIGIRSNIVDIKIKTNLVNVTSLD